MRTLRPTALRKRSLGGAHLAPHLAALWNQKVWQQGAQEAGVLARASCALGCPEPAGRATFSRESDGGGRITSWIEGDRWAGVACRIEGDFTWWV